MITFELEVDGIVKTIMEKEVDETFKKGCALAAEQGKREITVNFEEYGRPAWALTKDGRLPLYVTGKLKQACGEDARVNITDDGFELEAATGDRELVAIVQDARYGIYELPEDALKAIADSLVEGMMEG